MPDFTLFIPEYIAVSLALLILTTELIWPKVRKDLLAYMTGVAAIAYGVAAIPYIHHAPSTFEGVLSTGDFTTYFRFLASGIVLVISLLSAHYIQKRTYSGGEYYSLLLIAGVGMTLMASARELLTAYISLELLSFTLYILVGYFKHERRANEASLKYILLGAFSSAMLLYGISLLYGITGATSYEGIAAALELRTAGTDPGMIMAIVLIIAGVGFKVSAVPFHMWAPDAYEGAPLPITAFLATASKAAGFALIIRIFGEALFVDGPEWRALIAILAALTMTAGNLIAIQQVSMTRLVAYSSIGQVGYMLVVIAAMGFGDSAQAANGSSALLLHLTGYIVSTLALFTALTIWVNRTGDDSIRGMRGMAKAQPFLALVITAALFSFAGLPFFAGFSTKLLMFKSSMRDGLIWLIGLAVLNSFISLYYYLRVMRQMYLFDPPTDIKRFNPTPILAITAGLLLLAMLFIGIFPGPTFEAATNAIASLY